MSIIRNQPSAFDRPVRRGHGLLVRVFLLCLLGNIPPAFAMNWEGHDDWMSEEAHAQALRSNLSEAKPLTYGLPLCVEREKLHLVNAYEQRPIAGKNCVNSRTKTDAPVQ